MNLDFGLTSTLALDLDHLGRIIHPWVVDTLKGCQKRMAHPRDILKGEWALIKLATSHTLINNRSYQLLKGLIAIAPLALVTS